VDNTEHYHFLRQLDKLIISINLIVAKMSSPSGVRIPPIEHERLVAIFRPRRISLLFQYTFAVILFCIGLLFNVSTAGGFIGATTLSWFLGIAAMVLGVIYASLIEFRRRNTLLIITTWNVRVRTGLWSKVTKRIFYDDISKVEFELNVEGRVAGLGDIKIYNEPQDTIPTLEFNNIYNPEGVREIILRFVQTIPEKPPWEHLDKEDQLY
jgi:hypothetical protein